MRDGNVEVQSLLLLGSTRDLYISGNLAVSSSIFSPNITSRNSHLILSSAAGSTVTVSAALDLLEPASTIKNYSIRSTVTDLVLSSSATSVVSISASLRMISQTAKNYHIAGSDDLILSASTGQITVSGGIDIENNGRGYDLKNKSGYLIFTSSAGSVIAASGNLLALSAAYIGTSTTSGIKLFSPSTSQLSILAANGGTATITLDTLIPVTVHDAANSYQIVNGNYNAQGSNVITWADANNNFNGNGHEIRLLSSRGGGNRIGVSGTLALSSSMSNVSSMGLTSMRGPLIFSSSDGSLTVVSGGFQTYGATHLAVRTLAANTTLDINDSVILGNATGGSFKVYLPTPVPQGRQYTVKIIASGANNITLTGSASETIDGATSYNLDVLYESITVIGSGTAWYAI